MLSHSDNTDRKISEAAFAKTKELFQIHFAEIYLRCLCWDCEALLTAAESDADKPKPGAEVKSEVAHNRLMEIIRRQGRK